METKDKVLELLKNNAEPMKAGEIAENLGIDKKEIDKAIKTLGYVSFLRDKYGIKITTH